MQLTEKQKKAQEEENAIIAKCWEDETFKQQLINNPVETIENFTGNSLNLPEGAKLVVNDQTDPTFVHFNIPAKPNMDDVELNEQELEVVAGGDIGVAFTLWRHRNGYTIFGY